MGVCSFSCLHLLKPFVPFFPFLLFPVVAVFSCSICVCVFWSFHHPCVCSNTARLFAECLLLSSYVDLSLFMKITFGLKYNLEMSIRCLFNPGDIAKHINWLCFCNSKSFPPLNQCSYFHYSCTFPPDIVYYLVKVFLL